MCDLLLADSLAETGVRRYAAYPPTERRRSSLARAFLLSRTCGSLNLIVAQATVIEPCIQA